MLFYAATYLEKMKKQKAEGNSCENKAKKSLVEMTMMMMMKHYYYN